MPNNKNKVEGEVLESLPNAQYRIKLDDGNEIVAYLSGRMRINYIKVIPGDRVELELSPDGRKGRIVFRR